MSKIIDLSRSVCDLVTEYPELTGIMTELGFREVRKPAAGQHGEEVQSIPQKAKREGIPMEDVVLALVKNGFRISGEMPVATQPAMTGEEPMASVRRAKELAAGKDYAHKHQLAAALAAIPGHPLHTLTRENEVLSGWITRAKEKLAAHEDVGELLAKIRELSVHYAKKGDLLYPLLKVNYEVSGPSNVMWTEDDEIRDELALLATAEKRDNHWEDRVQTVLRRAEEMIYKENSILFPICAVNFTESEWQGIYRDARDYADCLGVIGETWAEGENRSAPAGPAHDGEVVLPGGHMTVEQLAALLNTIPLEITFVDADNINRFFNEGPKVFKRPGMAIDREVFSCHPPKIEPMVRSIIEDFRHNRRDRVPVWMEKGGRTMLVTYMAVRDKTGRYLGTVELVQDMEFAKEHFGING